MTPIQPAAARPSATPGAPDAKSPDEAARQFESVLVRQFVEVMTKDLFQSDQEGMMTGQADLQRDTLTDTLTDHLVDAGTFGIAELLTAQWERTGRIPDAGGGITTPPAGPPTFSSRGPKAPPPPIDMTTRTP
ncbi:hypothetical protein [Rubrivirga sp. IMCC43871]|uniref:hypothetical protein n=1 Tax=Rubrivirga sp. IMCC43871 TaxID=3391575 RepID=UPI00398FE2FE